MNAHFGHEQTVLQATSNNQQMFVNVLITGQRWPVIRTLPGLRGPGNSSVSYKYLTIVEVLLRIFRVTFVTYLHAEL